MEQFRHSIVASSGMKDDFLRASRGRPTNKTPLPYVRRLYDTEQKTPIKNKYGSLMDLDSLLKNRGTNGSILI